MVEVASLEEVQLRSVWRDEARDFTPWLAANPDLLGKELQMDLELEGQEVPVGTFSADLVLRDTNTGQRVFVENLLETTDHDHLGKLITYAAALEARWAVLVAKQFRPEHRSALTWLNSISGEGSGFFGIEVQAVRIADSPTAIRLDIVVKPDDFSRRARAEAKTVSETERRNTNSTKPKSTVNNGLCSTSRVVKRGCQLLQRFRRRLPPRLRTTRPDDAWRGAVPFAMANRALVRYRWGHRPGPHEESGWANVLRLNGLVMWRVRVL